MNLHFLPVGLNFGIELQREKSTRRREGGFKEDRESTLSQGQNSGSIS